MNTYTQGELVTLSASFAKRDGTPIDPATVRAQIKDPAGAVTSYVYPTDPEIMKDSTGEYHVDVSVTVVGDYCYRFDSTGTYQAANEGTFEVAASCMA